MAEAKKNEKAASKSADLNKQVPSTVISINEHKCKFVECKKNPEKAGFCSEHFTWFKAGLVTKEGAKAADFDKKHYHYTKRSA